MKRRLLALLLVGSLVAGAFAFAGCDTISPIDGPTAGQPDSGNNQGSGNGSGSHGSQGSAAWEKDDDYHWNAETARTLHTAENGVCTVCEKEVSHTVGLEYKLVTSTARSADNTEYYEVTGLGETTDEEIVIPDFHNGVPVSVIGDYAFAYSGITSVVLPFGISEINGNPFFGCTSLIGIYFCGTDTEWADVIAHGSESWAPPLYTYLKSIEDTPVTPGYYWAYAANGKIVSLTHWDGAGATVGKPLTIYYQTNFVSSSNPSNRKFHHMTQTLDCKILSVDGDNVRFELSDSIVDGGMYLYKEEVEITGGEVDIKYYWSEWRYLTEDDYADHDGPVELSANWGEPKACVDTKGEEYNGYIIKRDIPYDDNNARAELTYYVEVMSAKVVEGAILIDLYVRDITIGSSEYFYEIGNLSSTVHLTREELIKGHFTYLEEIIEYDPYLGFTVKL